MFIRKSAKIVKISKKIENLGDALFEHDDDLQSQNIANNVPKLGKKYPWKPVNTDKTIKYALSAWKLANIQFFRLPIKTQD